MTAQTRREQQRKALRDTILEAARESFIRDGYENFSMRKLGEKIQYSPGIIYLHFKDKDDLIHCLVEEGFARLLDVLQQIPDDKDEVRWLKKGLRAYIDFGLRNPHHYHFAFMMRRTGAALAEQDAPHPAFEVLRNAVRRCQSQKAFSGVSIETASQVIWATIHGITSLLIVRPDFPWVEKNRLINRMIDSIIAGLGQPTRKGVRTGGRNDS